VRSPLDVNGAYVPAIGLGAMEVSPLDMASAYATLAAGGIYSEPMAIRKVILPTGEDKSAGWGKPKRKRVISDGVAYEVTRILEENVDYGTGTGADYGHPSAGKTGTTEDWSDAWFCGYTPRLGTTVWVGYPKGKISMESIHGIPVTGGSFPAQIWRLFMSSAIGQLEPEEFPEPKDWPEWVAFERGQYARSFGYYDDDDDDYYSPPAVEEEEAEEEEVPDAPPASQPPPAPTTQAPAPAPAPTPPTQAPPPPVAPPAPPPTQPESPPAETQP
jgi:penicillin-binding protein 1A